MQGFPPDLVQPPDGPGGLDLTAPLKRAYAHMLRVLFPFELSKWLTLGLSAWIAHLGEGGGGTFSIPDTSGGRGRGFSQLSEFVRDNLGLVVAVGSVVFALALALGVAALWVSSRGKFVFLDNIAHDRALIEEPWRRFRAHGNSLFQARLVLSLLALAVVLSAAAAFGLIAWDEISAGVFDRRALIGTLVAIVILLLTIPLTAAEALLEDFVVPTMYLHEPEVRDGIARSRAALAGQWATVLAFYMLRIALSVGAAMIAFVVTCLTCCIASLPFIGTVVLLPVIVFLRCYVWFFYEQLGPEFQLIGVSEHDLPAP
ncbi:MAG TPA: hypothetical protein PKD61_01265 [Polyangiaceae bacterium]|nr:hypothetical protein [Polyangiaceae bacterium]